jgi:hypothetical protein
MITVVWNSHGFHVIRSLPKGIKWTGRYYVDNVLWQIAALRDVGSHRKMIGCAGNAGRHVAKPVMEYMDHNSLKRVPHPPSSPDVTPSDFYLFGHVKHQLQGYESTEGVNHVSPISDVLNQFPTGRLVEVFDDWMRRLQRCIDTSGEHVK